MDTIIEGSAGVLAPVSSLPGTHGIGDFGDKTKEFIELTRKGGFIYWQILPLNPLGYGHSPYQSYSAFAGDEIYINLDCLYNQGLLKSKVTSIENNSHHVDYEKVRAFKDIYFREAYQNFVPNDEYYQFTNKAFWLNGYAFFMANREKNDYVQWNLWKTIYSNDELKEEINYIKFLQYIFYTQWQELKHYANRIGIQIIGDIPIYMGYDSADVYFNPYNYLLDENKNPTFVSGVPPDYFSKDGQLWGNPLYDWAKMKSDNYYFWVERLSWSQDLYDIIRIDHFRAFDTYWKVPYLDKTAANGHWALGPSHHFFDSVLLQLPHLKLIVEDLGMLRPEVHELRDDYNLLGMRIIQFEYRDHDLEGSFQLPKQCIGYTGTHDNPSLKSWWSCYSMIEKLNIRRALNMKWYQLNVIDYINEYIALQPPVVVIYQVTDILKQGNSSRLNTPGTVNNTNWTWCMSNYDEYKKNIDKMKTILIKSNRFF